MKCIAQFEKVRSASRTMVKLSDSEISEVLLRLADAAEANIPFIVDENKKDLERMEPSNPKYDRLMLSDKRIRDIAADIRNVASLPCPIGELLEEKTLPNGLSIKKVRVPLGVVGVIYEARPNVTFDVFALVLPLGQCLRAQRRQRCRFLEPRHSGHHPCRTGRVQHQPQCGATTSPRPLCSR
jgi:glutamate-5-semialdehyde dehydrogenase